jgi:hypothetical protein
MARFAAAPDGPSIELFVRVEPAAAMILIDGTAVLSNPFSGRYRRDLRAHYVAALADGFDPLTKEVSFDADRRLEIRLTPRPAPEPSAGSAAAPTVVRSLKAAVAAPAPPPVPAPARPPPSPVARQKQDVDATGAHAALRPIQTSNPYGEP